MTTADLYATVTNQIVTALENGNTRPWACPWSKTGAGFPLRHNGTPYRGCNVLWLWLTATVKGFSSPYYMTFAQAVEYGGSVRKGEKATPVLFCQPMTKASTSEDGKDGKESYWIARSYNVFSADQIDGLPERFTVTPAAILDPAQRIQHAETYIGNLAADIRHGGGSAFYRPSEDYIQLPAFESFHSPEGYYATALHEACHWTGAASRLNRDLKGFGNRADYAREEIIAEMGACFACASLGIVPPDLGEHAAYIEHWIKSLKEDPRYLFSAASKAQAAADYLANLQPSV